MLSFINFSVAQTESLEEAAEKTGCLLEFIRRGVALGCFYYARCLHTGKGVQKNDSEAQKFFNKVSYVSLNCLILCVLGPWREKSYSRVSELLARFENNVYFAMNLALLNWS